MPIDTILFGLKNMFSACTSDHEAATSAYVCNVLKFSLEERRSANGEFLRQGCPVLLLTPMR